MDTRTLGLTRLALVLVATLMLAMVATVAVAEKADAHQTAGRVVIYIDGEKVKNTRDDHFVYRQRLAPGCHTVEVVQKRGGEVISRSFRRFCSDEPTSLIVKVDDGSVSTTTRAIDSA